MLKPALSQPNLVFAGTRTIRIGFNAQEWREWFLESQQQADPWGVVACFRNHLSSEKIVRDANGIRALIIYRDKQEREMGIVPRACWLQDYSDTTDVPVGESRCAILAIRRPGGEMVAPWRRRARGGETAGHDMFTTEAYTFDPGISIIEMRITGESNQPLLPPLVFDLAVVDGKPAAIRPR